MTEDRDKLRNYVHVVASPRIEDMAKEQGAVKFLIAEFADCSKLSA